MLIGTGLCLNRSNPAPLTAARAIAALLRGPMPVPSLFLGSHDFPRLDNWYAPALEGFPEPTDAQKNDFGLLESGQFSASIVGTPTLPTPTPEPRLTHRIYVAAGSGNAYAYHAFSLANYIIQAGDVLELDVNVDPLSSELTTYAGAFEIDFADGASGRTIPLTDQFGYQINVFNAAAVGAVGNFVTRRISLAQVAGKQAIRWMLVNEDDVAGHYCIAHYRNIRVTDGAGRTRLVLWANGNPTANAVAYSLRNGQSNVFSPEALKFETFTPAGGANAYTFWKISNASARVIIAADMLEYEVLVPADTADTSADGGIDLDFSDGTFGRTLPLVDQAGGDLSFFNSAAAGSVGKWYRRRISLAAVVGKTINFISLVSESNTAGRHTAYYRNIVISDGNGFIRQAIYIGNNPSLNALNYGVLNFATSLSVVNGPRLPGSFEEWLAAIRNQPVDLDLVTRVTRTDGSTTDFINERRGVVKSVIRKRGSVALDVVDVDRAARSVQFPIGTYTTADFPNLYEQHANRAIAQGVGLCEWLECTYVDTTIFKYAVCEIPAGLADPTIVAVYRGDQAGQGAVVPATEYATSTATVSGRKILFLTFAVEQLGYGSQAYVIGVKINQPGSRLPADEHARLTQLIGLSIDAADYADAAAYHQQIAARIDAWYTRQVAADAWLNKLEQAGRMWVSQSVGGVYTVQVDRPRDCSRVLWDSADAITIDERREPEVSKTITFRYRPRPFDSQKPWGGDLSRTTGGASGETIYDNEFIYDHAVADALLDYLTKRAQRATVRATLQGQQLTPGELIAVNSPLVLDGWKRLAATAITRPMDGNNLTLQEYTDSDYAYTPGTLPADGVSPTAPDYSFTRPLAPTGLAIVTNVGALDNSGKAFSTLRVAAVAPAVNWKDLWVVVANTVTGEETARVKMSFVAVDYQVTIGRLQPNTLHTVYVFATNANNIDGFPASTNVTTSNYTGSPPTPAAPTLAQDVGYSIQATVAVPTYPHHARVEWQAKLGAGGTYSNFTGLNTPQIVVSLGSYNDWYFRCRFIDLSGNPGAYSPDNHIVTSAQIADTHVIGAGINAASIGNSSINRGRSNTFTSTASLTINAGNQGSVTLGLYAFWPGMQCGVNDMSVNCYNALGAPADDSGILNFKNDSASNATVSLAWRNFSA